MSRTHVTITCAILVLALASFQTADAISDSPDIKLGGEIRLRGEAFDNLLDLADSTHDSYEFYRLRTRIWLQANPRPGLQLFFRFGNEYRMGRGENDSGIRDPESKLSIDNGWAEVARRRFRFRFGRMNLMYGEGFLIFDGTPADGSGSAWFDAMKLTLLRGSTEVDLLAAKIDEEGFGGSSRDEDLYGVYTRGAKVDLYLLRRLKRMESSSASGTIRPKRKTMAVGFRLAHQPDQGIRYALEGALQDGTFDKNESNGYGGYCRLGWRSPGRIHHGLEFGGLYLSGDDPTTEEYEGWDGFYSEWPKYSELYVYTMYDNTTRISPNEPGTWTNLMAGWLDLSAGPPRHQISARITSLRSVKDHTGAGEGSNRGLLLALRADAVLGEGFEGQIVAEFFDPGDFHAENADQAWYARWQLTASF